MIYNMLHMWRSQQEVRKWSQVTTSVMRGGDLSHEVVSLAIWSIQHFSFIRFHVLIINCESTQYVLLFLQVILLLLSNTPYFINDSNDHACDCGKQ